METVELRYDPFSSSGVDSNVFDLCICTRPGKFNKTVILSDVFRRGKETCSLSISVE